ETHGGGGGGMIAGGVGDVTNVTNVVFSNNQASGSGSPVGGGIGNGAGTLNVTGSTFDGNQSQGSGGGLYYSANSAAGSLTINNSTFKNNVTTGGDGGAIKTTSASTPYSISNSTFTGNQAQGTNGTGGAVVNESGTLNIDHSTFVNNQVTASAGRGGAIGSADGAGHNVTVNFSRFVGNSAATAANGRTLYGGTSSTLTANDNWWGVNSGPAANDRAGATTASTWLQLRHSASPSAIQVGQTSTLTADILGRNVGGPIAASALSGLPAFPMPAGTIFGNATLGTLSDAGTQFVNGLATATFTAGATGGSASANATADSQIVTATLTVTADSKWYLYLPVVERS
ncbi:MAG TPA: hypothetical protein VF897_22805, partial [Roseiflexaceae bacterium]